MINKYFYNLGSFFDDVSAEHAQRPALRYSGHQYSYSDLSQWVDKLGAFLLERNLVHGDIIAIGNNKSPLSYALMLAAIRLGVAYVNIDTGSPLERNLHIIDTSGVTLLFYDEPAYAQYMRDLAGEHRSAIELQFDILPDILEGDLERQKSRMLHVDGSTIAYVMFTSGSTGMPKGVAVTHQNVLHFIRWGQQYFEITQEDNFANLSPMYFDNSVFDFYVGLFSGASLSPIHRKLMNSPYDLVLHVEKMQCSVWFSVPSLLIYLMAMKALTPKALATLRYFIFGGEGYQKVELKKLYDLFSAQTALVNVYGPTECTCICSAYRLSDKDFQDLGGLPPLGKLNPNFDYRILDEDKDEELGELCLIGPNVAAGYFNDIERSAGSFFTLSDSRRFMKRMYRTGDLVREVDGQLHFVGRKDNQVKHMGYRIELEEIEHALAKLPNVNQAAVIYHRANTAYGKLIGFVASSVNLDEKHLLADLGRMLPDYMVPSSIIITTALPKNSNGKVDRQQLQVLVSK